MAKSHRKPTRTRAGKPRANGKKGPRRRLRAPRSGVSRAILRGSIPKSYISYESKNQDSLVVRGMEIVAEVMGRDQAFIQSWYMNPTRADLFPRLSAISLSFQRWRLRRCRLCYYTAAPATQSGEIGLVVLPDPQDQVPESAVKLGANDYSVVGSVAESLSTPWFENKDPEFLYLSPGGTSASPDPANTQSLKVLGARLGALTQHARGADVNIFSGYLAVEYDVELITPQPASQRVFSQQGTTYNSLYSTVNAPVNSYVVPFPGFDTVDGGQTVGPWPIQQFGDTVGPKGLNSWTAGTTNQPDLVKPINIDISPGTYDIRWDAGLSVETAYTPPPSEVKTLSHYNYVRPSLTRVSDSTRFLTPRVVEDWQAVDSKLPRSMPPEIVYYNPDYIKDPLTGWVPIDPSLMVVEGGIHAHRSKMRKLLNLAPAAAGDVATALYAYDPIADLLIELFAATISVGTAAATIGQAVAITFNAVRTLFLGIGPDIAEHQRLVNAHLSVASRHS